MNHISELYNDCKKLFSGLYDFNDWYKNGISNDIKEVAGAIAIGLFSGGLHNPFIIVAFAKTKKKERGLLRNFRQPVKKKEKKLKLKSWDIIWRSCLLCQVDPHLSVKNIW